MIHLTIIVLSKILVGIKFHLFLENTYPWNSAPPPPPPPPQSYFNDEAQTYSSKAWM